MNHKKGSLLVESIVSINIALIGLLGVLGLLSSSLNLNRNAGGRLIATYLSSEGVEVVKNIIDINYANGGPWNMGITDGSYEVTYDSPNLGTNIGGDSSRPLTFDAEEGSYSYDENDKPTLFRRTLLIENISENEVKVVSKVQWREKGRPQEVVLEDHFFNWR